MSEATSPNPETAPGSVALFKKRGAKGQTMRKRLATPPAAGVSPDSDPDTSAVSSSEDEAGKHVKRRYLSHTAAVSASSKEALAGRETDVATTRFAADRNLALDASNDATKSSNWFDEDGKAELSVKRFLGSTRVAAGTREGDAIEEAATERNGVYRGLRRQNQSYIPVHLNAKGKRVGPMKAPTNVRTVTLIDMAPDVCKDYKNSGWCGFGDSCKFLHTREAVKQGWELDREWESVTKGKKSFAGTVVASVDRTKKADNDFDEDEEALLETIPFVCIICRDSYRNPIITRCKHYFCERCALDRYRRDPSCAVCGAATNGVFNSAKMLQKLLDKKRERATGRRQQAIEAGDELGEEEEEG